MIIYLEWLKKIKLVIKKSISIAENESPILTLRRTNIQTFKSEDDLDSKRYIKDNNICIMTNLEKEKNNILFAKCDETVKSSQISNGITKSNNTSLNFHRQSFVEEMRKNNNVNAIHKPIPLSIINEVKDNDLIITVNNRKISRITKDLYLNNDEVLISDKMLNKLDISKYK